MNRIALGRVQFAGWLVLGAVAYACGGDESKPRTTGESHFLDYCVSSCAAGLDCISGVCTRGCLLGQAMCGDLSEQASCTDQSIEPGKVAVCDVGCDSNSDCSGLGAGHRCEGGYCRGGEPSAGSGGMSSTNTGGTGNGGEPGPGGAANGGAPNGGKAGGNPSGGSGNLDPICLLPADPGTCEALIASYYFDATTGLCRPFTYGGCDGNENRFDTWQDCLGSCGSDPTVPICFPGYELFEAAEGENTTTCRRCSCDGETECTDIDCDDGIPVYPCTGQDDAGDSAFEVDEYGIEDDLLTLVVTHAGGCEQRYTGLCFEKLTVPDQGLQSPVTTLRFQKQFVGNDLCDGLYEGRPVRFDLKPLRDAYLAVFGDDSGTLDTNYGVYGFGDLSCEGRVNLSNARIASVIKQLDNSCETDEDCMNVSTDTACYSSCGASIAKAAQTEFESALQDIDENVCTPYTEAGCPPPVALPCIPGMPTCQDGVCQ